MAYEECVMTCLEVIYQTEKNHELSANEQFCAVCVNMKVNM